MKKKPAEKICGACNACCLELKVDTEPFRKEAGVMCPHHTANGCGIYAKRFPICREFLCGWRLLPELGPEWRPDLSGVLILQVGQDELPATLRAGGNGLQFLILTGEPAIARPGFAEYVMAQVAAGVGVFLSSRGNRLLINPYLEDLARTRNTEGGARALIQAYRLLLNGRARNGFLRTLFYLYRLQLERWRGRLKPPGAMG